MTGSQQSQTFEWFRTRNLVFGFVIIMMAYVLYHNERFLIDAAHPVWNHYDPFKWWLLPHGLAGACALLLAPLQFAEGLRRRHTALHRTMGTIYVISVFILAPLGLYIQYLDEAQGAARSFTVETMIQSSALMITTGYRLLLRPAAAIHLSPAVDDPQLCSRADVPRDTLHRGYLRSGPAI